ncbi:multiple sugar transport system permease protein [Streptomyces sp. B4I13]|uniref:carbohydrate ABC transporter permease n=1 Tax=Streptomyces sp. B4I13 TaxID=3042271 RepID=UPI0027878AF2|nr:carbohydrate ABC transporter permease [Streptomyces sp. B4I13]MDQ0963805.1 multiple sugar transport system permease protein [Streptomyces sp. B4I13]
MTDRTEAVPPSLPAPRPHAIRRVKRAVRAPLKHCLLALCALTMLYPVLWMVVSSLRPNSQIFRSAGLALTHPRFENYSNGWNAFSQPFSHYLINSAIVVTGAILGNLLACSLAAYAFARLEFRAKRVLFAIMLVTIMLPIHVIIVPQYVLYSELGWVNTFLPLIVPKFLATDAFFIFLMVQFIRGIPREIDEAARIDGAGHARIFFHVILPLMVPALATTAIFTFIWTWNDFYTQLIYLTDPDMYTTPLALRTFVDQQSATDWGSVFAMSVVSLVPVFLVFLAGQRFLLRGIATTGGK